MKDWFYFFVIIIGLIFLFSGDPDVYDILVSYIHKEYGQ